MAGGMGGVPPQIQNQGQVAHPCNPATSGTQNAGEPKANGGGKNGGWRGRSPLPGGLGDVPPRTLRKGRVAHISNPPTSGTQNAGKPKANGGGKNGGSRGAKPPWQGVWGVSPHKTKIRGEQPALAIPPRVGPKTLANPKPTGVGKTGVQGGTSTPRSA